MHGWFHILKLIAMVLHIIRMKDKIYMGFLNESRKTFDKIQHDTNMASGLWKPALLNYSIPQSWSLGMCTSGIRMIVMRRIKYKDPGDTEVVVVSLGPSL
jgi:hypothetical protein